MATTRVPNHHRRSHSATSSSVHRGLADCPSSWKTATKRAHPHPSSGAPRPSSPSQTWGIDSWNNKRRRRNYSSSPEVPETEDRHSLMHSNRSIPSLPRPLLPSTAAEFNLFPMHERTRSRRSSHDSNEPLDMAMSSESSDESQLKQLRSHAFWELHKSVMENGEGLVRRMRDYENSRLRAGVYQKAKEAQRRGRKRSSLTVPSRKMTTSPNAEVDDEDDVQIFSGEAPDVFLGPSRCQRSLSLDLMQDASQPDNSRRLSAATNERCSSPSISSSSLYPSDEEDGHNDRASRLPSFQPQGHFPFSVFTTPALSQANTESARSSLSSLSLPSPKIDSPGTLTPPSQLLSLSASRSEKALAALSLAMANGAGSINDYSALLQLYQATPALDNSEVGSMWH